MTQRIGIFSWIGFALAVMTFCVTSLGAQNPPATAMPLTGRWQAIGFPGVLLNFTVNGSKLTGMIQQPVGVAEILDGAVTGDTLTFRARSADGDRTITFVGIIERERILFLRRVELRPGGRSGAAGMDGISGPDSFTAVREGSPLVAAIQLTGRWRATGFPDAWLNLVSDGSRVTGTVQNPGGPTEIFDGSIDGNTILFKTRSGDGDRVVTFTGRLGENQMIFSRSVEVRPGGHPGEQGIYGAFGPSTFTAVRSDSGDARRLVR